MPRYNPRRCNKAVHFSCIFFPESTMILPLLAIYSDSLIFPPKKLNYVNKHWQFKSPISLWGQLFLGVAVYCLNQFLESFIQYICKLYTVLYSGADPYLNYIVGSGSQLYCRIIIRISWPDLDGK